MRFRGAEPLGDTALPSARDVAAQELITAVFYALRTGCFFPVPEPSPRAPIQAWRRWGALRHLHDAIAAYDRTRAVT